MDKLMAAALFIVAFSALVYYAIKLINISLRTDLPYGKLMTRTALRRLYDDYNNYDFLTTPVLYINIFTHRLQTENTYNQIAQVHNYLENEVAPELSAHLQNSEPAASTATTSCWWPPGKTSVWRSLP